MYQRDYSGALSTQRSSISTSHDESYDDGGTDPFMLFRAYTWRPEETRIIRFRDLSSLPEKVQRPRASPPARECTDFEKGILSMKRARQPVRIDFDPENIPRAAEAPQWQTTKQVGCVEVVTYSHKEAVCDRYMRAQLTIKWRAAADKPWGEVIAQLESYPELQYKKYFFDVKNTTMGEAQLEPSGPLPPSTHSRLYVAV